ncbi:MAG: hypothetical protein QGF59_31275 [Pirellulaceae bacterium]|nr:hypothetical protein [Pirellulaceae bacterium]MDP6723185.1 hypothetical protein [Pirellulaceae bacterium]
MREWNSATFGCDLRLRPGAHYPHHGAKSAGRQVTLGGAGRTDLRGGIASSNGGASHSSDGTRQIQFSRDAILSPWIGRKPLLWQ